MGSLSKFRRGSLFRHRLQQYRFCLAVVSLVVFWLSHKVPYSGHKRPGFYMDKIFSLVYL